MNGKISFLFISVIILLFFLLNFRIVVWRKKDILGIDTGSIDEEPIALPTELYPRLLIFDTKTRF